MQEDLTEFYSRLTRAAEILLSAETKQVRTAH